MARGLGDLIIKIAADTEGAQKDLAKVSKALDGFAPSTRNALTSLVQFEQGMLKTAMAGGRGVLPKVRQGHRVIPSRRSGNGRRL